MILVTAIQVIFPAVLPWTQLKQPQGNAGISVGGFSKASPSEINKELESIHKLGFTWIRLDISWSHVQPRGPRQYDWTAYDPIITAARRNNLKVLGILDYAPAWAAQRGCVNHSACAPKDPTQFAIFAAQAADHYRKDVEDWEIWNEENTNQFWSPSPSVAQYTDLLKQSYARIKNANSAAHVILGGIEAGDNASLNQIDAVTFLQQLYATGVKGSFDAVGYHPYTYPHTPRDPNTAWTKLPALHSIMQANGDGAKQIWITEYGAPTNGPPGSGAISEAAQAQLASEAYTAARSQLWIGPFFWYTYQDRSTDTSTKENFFGLKRADGTPKPAYYAWQQLLAK